MTPGKHLLDQIVRGLDGVTAGEWYVDRMRIHSEDGDHLVAECFDDKPYVNAAHLSRCSPDTMREIAAYVRDLEERLAKAAEALEPFAKVEPMDVYEDEDEDARGSYILTQSDFRRARTTLSQIRSEK